MWIFSVQPAPPRRAPVIRCKDLQDAGLVRGPRKGQACKQGPGGFREHIKKDGDDHDDDNNNIKNPIWSTRQE